MLEAVIPPEQESRVLKELENWISNKPSNKIYDELGAINYCTNSHSIVTIEKK